MANKGNKRPPLVAPKRKFKAKKAAAKPGIARSLAARMTPQSAKKKAAPKQRKRAARGKTRKAARGNWLVRGIRWLFFGIFRLIWWVSFRVAVVLLLVVGSSTAYYYAKLPAATALMDDRKRGSVTLLDYSGKVFAWRGDQFGGLVDSQTVAPHLRDAVVATEDKRFYRHLGLSPRGIIGAIRTNMREGRHPLKGHGGSTITQQVAKRVYFSDLGSIERKLKEVPMSLAMEIKYTKDEILTIYMNRAYLGAGSHGFEAASQRYFSKSSSEVSVPEAAMLAGLLKAPSSNAPTRNMSRAQGRANLIIGLMQDQGYLTAAQATDARNNPAQLSAVAAARAGGYFADWIMESGPEFILKDTTEDIVIRTTFDKRIQKAAEEALAHIFETKVSKTSKAQAAIVVLSKDGAVRAIVGGRKSANAGEFNRATQALRQTGSSFKPFVYAAALEQGYRYDDIVEDAPLTIDIPGSGPWTPKNYDRNFRGDITLTEALAKSINTSAVRISEEVGRERVRALAADFGITGKLAAGPALALGASESTLLEMTGAYAGILNSGRSALPYGVIELTIQGDSEPLIANAGGTGRRVISDKAAGQLIYMMNQVVEVGSGRRAKLPDRQAAGKTGTTQGARDAWFVGFTADYVAGVWMGYDDNTKLKGTTGGGLPANIWHETMVRVHDGVPVSPLPIYTPPPIVVEEDTGIFGQRRNPNNPWRQARDQVEQDLKQLDREAENVLGKVLEGIFGKRKKKQ
ncbi:MAG: PBP1A family penicillin-binding protein [Rhodobacteraceae bacterium]|nr:PBP1A family penicillin-binding protein [Paracoccaceae bacterium]